MKFSLLINSFIILLRTPLLYTMHNNLDQVQARVAHCSNNLEDMRQILNSRQQTINDLREGILTLERNTLSQLESHKNEQANLNAHNNTRILTWIAGSGMGVILIGCIAYLFWKNRVLKKELESKDPTSRIILE